MALRTMITITHGNISQYDIERLLLAETNNRFAAGHKLMSFVRSLMSGNRPAKVQIGAGAVQATGTVTLVSFVANDTVTINGVVLTGKASPATEAEFACGVSDTADAAALAAAINVHSTLSLILSATSALGVVTITALKPGLLGNCVTLAISAHGSVSAARMASGTDGVTEKTHYYGHAS
jgi:phage tail sheath gpL-like